MANETEEQITEEASAEEIKELPIDEPEIKEEAPAAEERIEKIVQGIKDKLDEPIREKGPSPEAIRLAWKEQVKKETSMTDAQIDYMENRLASVVAPIHAENTYGEWKAEKQESGITIEPEVEKAVKEYLSKYDPKVRNDKVLLDNVLFMEIGKRAVTKKPVAAKPAGGAPVPGRTIVPQTPAPAASLAAGIRRPAGAAALTPEEKVVARKMRMTEVEYAAAKDTAVISELKKK